MAPKQQNVKNISGSPDVRARVCGSWGPRVPLAGVEESRVVVLALPLVMMMMQRSVCTHVMMMMALLIVVQCSDSMLAVLMLAVQVSHAWGCWREGRRSDRQTDGQSGRPSLLKTVRRACRPHVGGSVCWRMGGDGDRKSESCTRG